MNNVIDNQTVGVVGRTFFLARSTTSRYQVRKIANTSPAENETVRICEEQAEATGQSYHDPLCSLVVWGTPQRPFCGSHRVAVLHSAGRIHVSFIGESAGEKKSRVGFRAWKDR